MYTSEQLVTLTGYTKGTIYTHSIGLEIRPIRGTVKGNKGKGIYSQEDLDKLLQYKQLILEGASKSDAYIKVLSCRP